MNMNLPHRRFNPLVDEWVLVSPQRDQRPWLGQVENKGIELLPKYDPTCYLCPGNERAGGRKNEDYSGTFVFDNDFPALLMAADDDNPGISQRENALLRKEPVSGLCRVVCFSPRHDLTLPELSPEQVIDVVRTWKDQTSEISQDRRISYVQIFENKGAIMGCSNPHPHSQIWATSFIPNEPAKEAAAQKKYRLDHNSCLLCDTLAIENNFGNRIVVKNKHFTALVPFWAIWPFEILVIAQDHLGSLVELDDPLIADAADILSKVTIIYDNLFETSFPYSMGFHQAPFDGNDNSSHHLHMHFFPPLLRSATIRKFMVGYEMLAMPQRDLTPEQAAERLRGLKKTHYLID